MDQNDVTVRGVVAAVRPRTNLNGQPWSEVRLRGGQHVLVFPKEHGWYADLLVEGDSVEITGHRKGGDLFAHSITGRS